MKNLRKAFALCTVSAMLSGGVSFAQEHRDDQQDHHGDQQDRRGDQHDNHTYVRHNEWRKGYHMQHQDWDRGERVDDWQTRHLRRPPNGYEWREVDGNYVMAAVATGIIASVIVASHGH